MKKQVNCQFQKAYEEEENLIRNFKKLMKKKNKSMCRQHQVKQSCVSILNNTQIQGRPTLLVRGLSNIFDIKIAIIAHLVSPHCYCLHAQRCVRCGKICMSQYQLQQHKRTHNAKQLGSMACPHCDRTFQVFGHCCTCRQIHEVDAVIRIRHSFHTM